MGTTNVIPSQPQPAPSGGSQIEQLLGVQNSLNQAITNTIPAAITPVAQPGVSKPHLAGSFEFGVGQPKQAAPQGAADAKHKGIASTIAGVANIIGNVKQAEDQKDQRVLAGQIGKVMEAQDAISKASSIQKDDPGFKDAQAAIEKNKQIINDMMADKKVRGKMEKAFDINFIDPSQNNKPEHAAMQQAAKTYADQLQSKTVQQLGPNTGAQQKLQVLAQQQKSVTDTIKALSPMQVQAMKGQNELDKQGMIGDQKAAEAATKATTEAQTAQTRANSVIQAARIHGQSQVQAAGISASGHVKAAMYTADKRYQGVIDGIQKKSDLIATKVNDPVKQMQAYTALGKQVSSIQTGIQQQISNLEANRKNADPSVRDQYDKQIQQLESQQGQYAAIAKQFGDLATNEVSKSANAGSAAPTTATSGNDDSEDETSDRDSELYQ